MTDDIRRADEFYHQALGLRLVKRSVNQDDVSAYHLFYADAVGTPGTDLTFFDWDVPGERRGAAFLAFAGDAILVAHNADFEKAGRSLADQFPAGGAVKLGGAALVAADAAFLRAGVRSGSSARAARSARRAPDVSSTAG